MTLWAVIPAKDPRNAKKRLASVLQPEERYQLSMELLTRTLSTVRATSHIDHYLVISTSREVEALATQYGAHTVQEQATAKHTSQEQNTEIDIPLNAALKQGIAAATAKGATAVLILAADLPMLSVPDLEQLPKEQHLVISPDRSFTGTNALFMSPPIASVLQFGVASFARHYTDQASLWSTPALRSDLDTPEDLCEIRNDPRAAWLQTILQ